MSSRRRGHGASLSQNIVRPPNFATRQVRLACVWHLRARRIDSPREEYDELDGRAAIGRPHSPTALAQKQWYRFGERMESAQVTTGGQEQERLPREAAIGASGDGGAMAAAGSGADSSGEETGDWVGGGPGQDGAYRKRGRPRKYEGLDEAERRKRRMADNRQSAKR